MTAQGTAEVTPSRIQALRNKHAIINSRIEEAQRSPSSADFHIRQLKKKRLQIQEEIETFRKRSSSS
jgi:hypothetical protein